MSWYVWETDAYGPVTLRHDPSGLVASVSENIIYVQGDASQSYGACLDMEGLQPLIEADKLRMQRNPT